MVWRHRAEPDAEPLGAEAAERNWLSLAGLGLGRRSAETRAWLKTADPADTDGSHDPTLRELIHFGRRRRLDL